MLNITVNNIPLEIPKDFSILVIMRNPMFGKKGSGSLEANVSAKSIQNLKAFGFPQKPTRKDIPNKDYDIDFWYPGTFKFKSTLRITDIDNNNIRFYIKLDNGSFYGKIKDKMLQDLELGGERVILPFETDDDFSYPEDDYCMFPVYNELFYDGTLKNDVYLADIKYQNYPSGQYSTQPLIPNPLYYECITPFPFMGYVVTYIFNNYGYLDNENIFKEHPDLKKICEVSFTDTVKTELTFNSLDPNNPSVATYNGITKLSNHLPKKSILKYLEDITNKYNIHFFVNENSQKVIIKNGDDIINNKGFVDVTKIASSKYKNMLEEPFDSFVLKQNSSNGDEFYDYSVKDYNTFQDRIIGSVGTYDDLYELTANVGDVCLVNILDSFFECIAYDDVGTLKYKWEFLCNNNRGNYYVNNKGENQLKIDSEISEVITNIIADSRSDPERLWKVPYVKKQGNSFFRLEGDVENGHRNLLYHGLQPDSLGNTYQFGSDDCYKYDGIKIDGANLTLRYGGTYGIYNQLWKKTIHWKMNIARNFKRKIYFDVNTIFNFPWWKKHRILDTNYFVKEIRVKLTATKPIIDDCEIVKCN